MTPEEKEKRLEQLKERKRVHSRAFHGARNKALSQGKSQVDQLNFSMTKYMRLSFCCLMDLRMFFLVDLSICRVMDLSI